MTHQVKEGFFFFFLLYRIDNFYLADFLGITHDRLCRLYRGTEKLDRNLLNKALSLVDPDEEVFDFLVEHYDWMN